MKYRIAGCLVAAITMGTTSVGLAHTIAIEEQALYPVPRFAPPGADFSFEHPDVLSNVADSQAIFAYLTAHDVDVFQFTLTAQDVATGPVLVAASALPPACWEYQNVYPVTALVGPQAPSPMGPPGLPPPDASFDLPFVVPSGMGVVFADNPRICYPQKREIFTEEDDSIGRISWFLPEGLSQTCLLSNQLSCDFTHTIARPVFYPGTYYIVIWNPSGVPTDYTANIGYGEANYQPNPELEALVRNNRLLHRTCHTPYPFR